MRMLALSPWRAGPDSYSWAVALLSAAVVRAQGPENVLVVVNNGSALSRAVGEYYARVRHIPKKNVCGIGAPDKEEIVREEYDRSVAAPVAGCLARGRLTEQILYIVTTAGVPLKIRGPVSPYGRPRHPSIPSSRCCMEI